MIQFYKRILIQGFGLKMDIKSHSLRLIAINDGPFLIPKLGHLAFHMPVSDFYQSDNDRVYGQMDHLRTAVFVRGGLIGTSKLGLLMTNMCFIIRSLLSNRTRNTDVLKC